MVAMFVLVFIVFISWSAAFCSKDKYDKFTSILVTLVQVSCLGEEIEMDELVYFTMQMECQYSEGVENMWLKEGRRMAREHLRGKGFDDILAFF